MVDSIHSSVFGDDCLWWKRSVRDASGSDPDSEELRTHVLKECSSFNGVATIKTGPERHVLLRTPQGRCLITVRADVPDVVVFDYHENEAGERIRFWMNNSSVADLSAKLKATKERVVFDDLWFEHDPSTGEMELQGQLARKARKQQRRPQSRNEKIQERQLEWLRKLESREELDPQPSYNVTCNDCRDGIECHAAITGIDFIRRHSGHYTWVQFLGRTRQQLLF